MRVRPPRRQPTNSPSGLQHPPQLGQRTRQIVDVLQGQQRQGEIETGSRQRQRFRIADHEGETIAGLGQGRHTGDGADAAGAQKMAGGGGTRRPEVEHFGKRTQHRGETIVEILGKAGQQEIGIARTGGAQEAETGKGRIEEGRWMGHLAPIAGAKT